MEERRQRSTNGGEMQAQGQRSRGMAAQAGVRGGRVLLRALPLMSMFAMASAEGLGFVSSAGRLPMSSPSLALRASPLAPQRPALVPRSASEGLRRRARAPSVLDANARLLGAAGATTMLRLGRLALAAPLGCLQVYQYLLGRYTFEVNAMTGVVLYLLGKLTSDKITKQQTTPHDLRKWACAGLMDGAFTHWWYKTVAELAMPITDEVARLAFMVSTTSFLYSPIYCFLFITIMAGVDGKSPQGIKAQVKSDWWTLSSATSRTWMIPNVILFTCIMPQYRLLVSMVLNYMYLIGLALWESGNLAIIMKSLKSKIPGRKDHSAEPAGPSVIPSAVPALATASVAGSFGFSDNTIDQGWDRGVLSENLIKEVADVPLPEEIPLRTPDDIVVPPGASPLFNDLGHVEHPEMPAAMDSSQDIANPEWDPSAPLVGFEHSDPLGLETQFAFDNTGGMMGLDPQPLALDGQPFESNIDSTTGFPLTPEPVMQQQQPEDDITM
mmetsp:Transcript_18784/g.29312  ORF Transcript_18784/g.29312 Transcript_18784/m.29312 type:complete len:497 (+) Transcript_18784:190-1680(+)